MRVAVDYWPRVAKFAVAAAVAGVVCFFTAGAPVVAFFATFATYHFVRYIENLAQKHYQKKQALKVALEQRDANEVELNGVKKPDQSIQNALLNAFDTCVVKENEPPCLPFSSTMALA